MEFKTSILLLHRTSLGLTRRCVQSLRNLDTPLPTLIVIDNAAPEPCAAAVAELWPGALQQRVPANLGVAGGRNLGFRLAAETGAGWVMCVDDDLRVEPATLSAMLARLQEEESAPGRVAAVAPKVLSIKNPQVLVHTVGKHYHWLCHGRSLGGGQIDAGQFDHIRQTDWFPGLAGLYNLAAVAALGGFDERLSPYGPEDQEWCQRARRAGWRLLFASRARVWHPAADPSTPLNLHKVEYLLRGQLTWITLQPELAARLGGLAFAAYRFGWQHFWRAARQRQGRAYLSACWRAIR